MTGNNTSGHSRYTVFQLTALVALRFVIGWHFFYEGIIKISNPRWSAAFFLKDSRGPFSGIFQWLASDGQVLSFIDTVNIWLLTLTGLFLISGIFIRTAACTGILLLMLYYLAAPPWPGLEYTLAVTGNYLIINDNILELAGMLILVAFPTSHIIGLERLVSRRVREVSHDR